MKRAGSAGTLGAALLLAAGWWAAAPAARVATADSAAAAAPESSASAATPAESSGTIAVTVTGVRARDGGDLIVSLYRGPDGWLKSERAFARRVVPVAGDSAVVVFRGAPFDTGYAVAVVHDKNGNGKMDLRIFPYPRPKEGVGVSGNAVRMGPPKYDRARFALAATNRALRIIMRY